ncbi:MAG: helix-turn-helix transcriptional regulator [Flavobacteriales bacterium]|nr:helix-turn-helix transcriptional regulator [Flavobacteriales bacterium]
MGTQERWNRIAEAVLACAGHDTIGLKHCGGLAEALDGMGCGILLHRPGQMVPLFYNAAVARWVGVAHAQFGPAKVLELMPRLTSSAMAHVQLYGQAFGRNVGGPLRLQFLLLDSDGTERAFFGHAERLDAEHDDSPVLTVFYDVELLVASTKGDHGLMEALTPERSKAFSTLTGREKEVLALVALEKGRKEIADLLCIDPQTVKTHLKNMKRKLGVANTLGLMPYLCMVATIVLPVHLPQRGRKPI